MINVDNYRYAKLLIGKSEQYCAAPRWNRGNNKLVRYFYHCCLTLLISCNSIHG